MRLVGAAKKVEESWGEQFSMMKDSLDLKCALFQAKTLFAY